MASATLRNIYPYLSRTPALSASAIPSHLAYLARHVSAPPGRR